MSRDVIGDQASGDQGVADQPVADQASTSDVATGQGCTDAAVQQCGAPTQCGPVVATSVVAGNPPAASGGTIAPGLYLLTGVNLYGNAGAAWSASFQLGASFGGATFAEYSYADGMQQSSILGSYAVAGSTLSREVSCPTTVAYVNPYTATTSGLIIYRSIGDAGTYELVTTKQ